MYFGQYYTCTILSYFILLALQIKKNKQTNRRMLAGTLQQLWPIITVGPDTNKKNIKKKKYQKTQQYKKNYRYIQQVIKRDKGRALLYFIQIDLNERGSSQS